MLNSGLKKEKQERKIGGLTVKQYFRNIDFNSALMKWTSLLFLTLFIVASCATSSKGDWTKSDKRKAEKAVASVKDQLYEILGSKADHYIRCYLYKVEQHYSNFEEADHDQEGCERLAKECMQDLD